MTAKPPPLPPRNGNLPPLPPSRRTSTPARPADLLPQPPQRVASLASPDGRSDFESRFRFHAMADLPQPDDFSGAKKTYPTQMPRSPEQATRRAPVSPPPPPPPR